MSRKGFLVTKMVGVMGLVFVSKLSGFVGLKGCCKNGRGACKVEGVGGVKGYSLGFLYG